MRYGSVCSGIEAATAAWHDLGWKPSFFSEIEAFPRAVLKNHYPDIPLHGDFTTITGNEYDPIDLLVGGTPCQSFSIAGLRGGLADDRGNLALEFLRLAQRTRPRWLVWENVPGVLSSNGGRDFGSIIGGMVELGYGMAYRILDAQYFGVAQRRRRVFVVGYLGDWRPAAAVLFERHSLQGHPPPRREKGQRVTGTLEASLGRSRGAGTPTAALNHWDSDDLPHPTLNQSNNAGGVGQSNQELFSQRGAYLTSASLVAPTIDANFGRLHGCSGQDANHGHGHLVAFGGNRTSGPIDVAPALLACKTAAGRQDFGSETFIAFHAEAQADQLPSAGRDTSISDSLTTSQHAAVAFGGDVARTLSARYDSGPCADRGMDIVANQMKVRRLTPKECERLQGFPDDYTAIPWRGKPASDCPDGPRYKALGNSMAVPVMRWIGQRIKMVELNNGN